MKLLFDATVLEYPPTGVAKVTLGLYSACQVQDAGLEIIALHRRRLFAPLPPTILSSKRGVFLPPGLWRQVYLPAMNLFHKTMQYTSHGTAMSRTCPNRRWSSRHFTMFFRSFSPDTFPTRSEKVGTARSGKETSPIQTCCFTDSEFSKQQILKNFQLRREPVVIPFGPTLHPNQLPSGAGNSGYFLYVGGYDPRKGLQQLLSAFLNLHREGKLQSKLVLTGTRLHVSETFQRLVSDGVRMGVVEERGYVSDETLASLYTHALALVYPSKYEGFGLPPLEAMTRAVPSITDKVYIAS